MSQYQRSPSLGQVLDRMKDTLKKQTRVALPAIVQAYDSTTQTVDAQPAISESTELEDGTVVPSSFPVVTHVPVAFPGAGGFRITFPIAPGDTGLLVFADRSIDLWQQQGGQVNPGDERRHHLADAVFIPGVHPDNASWTGAGPASLTMGKDGGPQAVFRAAGIELGGSDAAPPTDFVALASKVLADLTTLISTYNSHTHLYSPGPSPPIVTAPPIPAAGAPASVASSIVKSA